MKIIKKEILPFLILIYLIVSEIFMDKVEILKYSDEIIAVFSIIYIILKLTLTQYRRKCSANTIKIIFAMCLLIIVGIISNVTAQIQTNWFIIGVDIISNFKIILISIAIYMMINKEISVDILKKLNGISKIFIVLGLFFGIISLFVDLGMRGEYRYGIYCFNFIFSQAHIYSMFLLFALLVVVFNTKKERTFFLYWTLVNIQLILTTKGISILTVACSIFIYFFIYKKGKINFKIIIPMGIAASVLGGYQINTYLLNDTAPRAVLYLYGMKTAMRYFPIGAGFATFGSDMAAKNYSLLYMQYGFFNRYGMSPDKTSFLNDNYWPMILGQFGIIGTLIVVYIIYIFLKILQKVSINRNIKTIMFTIFFYMIIASTGTTIFTTSATIILCLGVMLVLKVCNREGDDKKNEKDYESYKKQRYFI